MTAVNLHLLGSPHFEQSEQIVPLHRRRRSIALLAYLVMTAQPHSRERLATLLWPDHDPERARANLRRDLSYLKRQLGDNLITADREQIALNHEMPLCVDACLFTEKVTAVQQHNHSPETSCAGCVATLTDAVALYQDDFMAGYTLPDSTEFDEWQFFQRESLRQQLAIALQQLISWLQGDAAYEEAIVYGRRWLALDPLHEPGHRLLMQLYARAGQQAAALRQYELCKELLLTELGVEPEPETTTLFEAIKSRQFQPSGKTQSGADVTGKTLASLPLPTTPFIGRAKEIEEIGQLLRTGTHGRLCTITGPGGIGKTRLALEVASTLVDDYPAAYFVPLASVSAAEGMVSAIAERIHCRFYGSEEPRQQLLEFLGRQQLLLILDNFEHLLAGSGLIVEMLHHAPRLTLLVTSRERLNLSEETVYSLNGLALPKTAVVHKSEDADAVKLLRQRACMVRPEITFSLQDDAALARICTLVQGMPLAIVLAASWLDMLSLEQVADEISKNLDFLTTEMRDLPARQRSIRAVYEASWKQLTVEEQEMFMKLSVFRGGFTWKAAQAITGGELRQLRQLINKSLLTASHNGRYEMHELLRQFAAEQLAISPEVGLAAQNAHCVYYANFLQGQIAFLMGDGQRQGLAAMTAEYDNIWAAWEWGIQEGRLSEVQLALWPLQLYCQFKSHYLEGVLAWKSAYQQLKRLAASPARDQILAELLVYWGWLLIRLGQLDEAETRLQACQSLYEQLGQSFLPGYGTDPAAPMSLIATIRGDYETAVAYGRQSVEANCNGHARNLYNAYYVLTSATVSQGAYAVAQQYAQQAYTLMKQANDRWFMAYVLIEMGKIALALEDLTTAQEHFSASYQLRQEFEDPEGMAIALTYLGQLLLKKKSYGEAQACYQESLTIYQEINDKGGLVRTYLGLGQSVCAQGEFQAARQYFHQAIVLAVEMNFVSLLYSILNAIAGLFIATEQWARGLELYVFVSQQSVSDQATRAEAEKHLALFASRVADSEQISQEQKPEQTLTDVLNDLLSNNEGGTLRNEG